jgi:hypothetical protein
MIHPPLLSGYIAGGFIPALTVCEIAQQILRSLPIVWGRLLVLHIRHTHLLAVHLALTSPCVDLMDKTAQDGRQGLDFAIQRIDLAFNAFGDGAA